MSADFFAPRDQARAGGLRRGRDERERVLIVMLTLHVATTSFVANAVGNHRGRTISPIMNEAAAKAAWLAKMEGPQWGLSLIHI